MEYRKLSNLYSTAVSNASLLVETYTPAQIEKYVKFFSDMSPNTPVEYIRTTVQRFSRLKDTKRVDLDAVTREYIAAGVPAGPPLSFSKHAYMRETKKDADSYTHTMKKLGNNPTDITLYTFGQLDDVVNSFEWPEDLKVVDVSRIPPTEGYPAKVVYQDKKNGITIFYAQDYSDSKEIRLWLEQQDERSYNWCVSTNMTHYTSYRFGNSDDSVRSLYYIHDKGVRQDSDQRVTVIQVNRENRYFWTNASNTGPDAYATWEECINGTKSRNKIYTNKRLALIPNPESIFIFYPLTNKEKAIKTLSSVNPPDFKKLIRYADKYFYIAIQQDGNNLSKNKKLLMADFIKLPKQLQHAYISVRAAPEYSPSEILTLLIINLFHDSDERNVANLIVQVNSNIKNNIPNWLKPLTENNTINNHCTKETRDYYRKLIYRYIRTLGGGPRDNNI